MKKIITITTLVIVLFSGCSVKNEDSTAEKVVKHTINSPLYVLVVGGVLVGGVVNVLQMLQEQMIRLLKRKLNHLLKKNLYKQILKINLIGVYI